MSRINSYSQYSRTLIYITIPTLLLTTVGARGSPFDWPQMVFIHYLDYNPSLGFLNTHFIKILTSLYFIMKF